ncbi:MAG TPA: hypothetical protein GXX48_23155 [Ochrobactrum intermedium]|uniref:DUF4393 domain-containing protein n=1 Tax=Brucella intermedia TaxID=94625 RepID=A0A7V6PGQ1_9HYPH|nr:Abi-alpha family protein [Brucella intermedia]HHV70498.1 hypothetical protein [Brucella intermedia]
MSDSTGDKSVRVLEIGKEIDRTIAEVVGELLKPSARELGSLFGDSIGLLSDRIRVKRQINTERALEVARRQLDEKGVGLDEIAAPPGEDIHLMLNGMSLNDDTQINDLWAGLFAQALDPKSVTTERRAYIRALETFSALDARIVDFIAYFEKQKSMLSQKIRKFNPKDWSNITPEESNLIENNRIHNDALLSHMAKALQSKAGEFGLLSLPIGWSDNLVRQSIIEPNLQTTSMTSLFRPNVRDIDDLVKTIGKIAQKIDEGDRIRKVEVSPPDSIFFHESALVYKFTKFGTRFANECGIL